MNETPTHHKEETYTVNGVIIPLGVSVWRYVSTLIDIARAMGGNPAEDPNINKLFWKYEQPTLPGIKIK